MMGPSDHTASARATRPREDHPGASHAPDAVGSADDAQASDDPSPLHSPPRRRLAIRGGLAALGVLGTAGTLSALANQSLPTSCRSMNASNPNFAARCTP